LIFLGVNSDIADKWFFLQPSTAIPLLLISGGLSILHVFDDDQNLSNLQALLSLFCHNCFLNYSEAFTGSYKKSKNVA
jgi:hypothetical protein